MKELIKKTEYVIVGEKTTICLITLHNGFEIIGTSACVDPANFDKNIGEEWARQSALNKLEEIYGFVLQEKWARDEL